MKPLNDNSDAACCGVLVERQSAATYNVECGGRNGTNLTVGVVFLLV